jgi:hypothetical protein
MLYSVGTQELLMRVQTGGNFNVTIVNTRVNKMFFISPDAVIDIKCGKK